MLEIWKDVKGYEDLFQVSNCGRFFSKRTNKILKQVLSKTGYMTIPTKIGGRNGFYKLFRVHRIVAESFLDKPCTSIVAECENTFYGKIPVNHKDGDKTNNCVENLEWCTYSENSKHAVNSGLFTPSKGSSNGMSYFDNEDHRLLVYNNFIKSGMSMRQFAKTLGISHTVVSRLVRDFT